MLYPGSLLHKLVGRLLPSMFRWTAANDNASSRLRLFGLRRARQPLAVHIITQGSLVKREGGKQVIAMWDLKQPRQIAILYLRYGRRLRLPAPATLGFVQPPTEKRANSSD